MAISIDAGPSGGAAKASRAFSAMSHRPVAAEDVQAGGASARVNQPLPIFAPDLARLRDEGAAALADAPRTGWRYLVGHKAGLAVVDLPEAEQSQPRLLADPGLGARLARSGRKAERAADPGANYEARILDLNLIGNSVLWLRHQNDQSGDLFVSLGETPKVLDPKTMFRQLQGAAARKLTALKSAGSEGGG
jgi:hypothetical protein